MGVRGQEITKGNIRAKEGSDSQDLPQDPCRRPARRSDSPGAVAMRNPVRKQGDWTSGALAKMAEQDSC